MGEWEGGGGGRIRRGEGGRWGGGEAFTQLCCRHQNDIALKVLNMQWHEPLY